MSSNYLNPLCGREDRRHRSICSASDTTYDTLSGRETHHCYGQARYHLTAEWGGACSNLCRSHAQKYRRNGLPVEPIDYASESRFGRWYVYSSPLTAVGYFWLVAILLLMSGKVH